MDMVEKVARKHWEARRSGFSIPRLDMLEVVEWDQLPQQSRSNEISATRAAIEAMREPSKAMLGAAGDLLSQDKYVAAGQSALAWTAMIDQVLSDQPRLTEEKA